MSSEETFLEQLRDRLMRGPNKPGGNPHWFLELFGAKEVINMYYEPDPNTFRYPYYYNTRENRMYTKGKSGYLYYWQPVQ
jgi:hypothetical protein